MNKTLSEIIILLVLLTSNKILAQVGSENIKAKSKLFSVAISPATILELEPSLNLHFMYKYNDKYSTAIEVGRIVKLSGNNKSNSVLAEPFTGWRFRPEFRFWKRSSTNTSHNTAYIAIQGLVKIAEKQVYDAVQRTTPSGLFYVEGVERNINKTVLGVSFILGEEADLFKEKQYFTDLFTGFGIRSKYVKDNMGTDFRKTEVWNLNNKTGVYPTIIAGLRVGRKF